ncbi:heavy metal translocating P-type ATPase [Clostridium saccharoperbutylacetonicum]|uniref:Cd(2+)-exporting ATPase n=2 Tax=Clostridium TaxID=1485 RepID=M1N682_9CLOT|nr:cation-translocating P-type ATPase [Clostridium saccharoperbutylacetonicum]AGF58917.1 heavy metal translocating P-type ATPase [Clostridium saccharoperbutylacetonicum N1-4(HMT)]NRT60298.1 heavy metal translocating P-type ATPase [Clostridium saccharoperbutylacetonicum]NSB23610.1 heavy metal translocating P-type ATPase [Clostridium saccharoperbutylacetonicum]NSB42981.1 heavy metal translocating P-type ATPase [Clostridium saccharoperbutylacetonicum]
MDKMKEFLEDEDKRTVIFLILSAFSLLISFLHIWNFKIDIAWLAIILCGAPIVKGAIVGLVTEFDIKADVLVAVALVASVLIGETFAAGEVAFIMTLGALLEERTVAKAREGIEKLVTLTPRTARIVRDGIESIIPAEEVKISDILRVLPGETIAVDGIITSGQTSINQSVMTGESMPVDKGVGDEVFSGTVNQFGAFDMKATKVDEDSSLKRMIKLVESADASKAKIVGMADKWATWIVVIALVSAAGTWFVTGEIIRAVTILVVFCPCSLVLATPTAIMAGIGNATKHGILVHEGDTLERLAKVRRIAFDKTGTLTYGKPDVVAIESFDTSISSEKLLAITASAELRSEHPLGKSIVSHFKTISSHTLEDPQEFELIAGRGVKSIVSGNTILAGNTELLTENSIEISKEILDKSSTFIKEGCTVIYIAVNSQTSGFIVLSDTLREDSKSMIKKLNSINVESILLTGDNPQAASHIAKNVGITNVHAECLPEDKMSAIEAYQNNNEMICMIGDGINDAPALKKAYVGIAMGGIGSDIAVDAADIALVSDDIKSIPHLLSLAQKTMNTIKWNLSLSMLLNFVAIILAMTGILNPILGALVHNLGSVAVIINSALLLNFKDK